jgi:hypothetical protein|tara:strand:+ start:390 stop:560 length:171 start_codon:yes stop_codon:yes gene_type:complete
MWHEYLHKEGHAPEWPYPILYEGEQEIDADIQVLGGGIAGCWVKGNNSLRLRNQHV